MSSVPNVGSEVECLGFCVRPASPHPSRSPAWGGQGGGVRMRKSDCVLQVIGPLGHPWNFPALRRGVAGGLIALGHWKLEIGH